MAKHSFPWLLVRSFRRFQRQRPTAGFTLLELLISMFIGGIITTVLLYGVVELLKTNQRESSRAETQREMQLAMDYISNDLRQAVFVYDGTCLSGTTGCPGVTPYIPASVRTAPSVPVLAFWRVDELPQTLINLCATNSATLNSSTVAPPTGISGVPCLSRRTYTLVVYSLDTANSGNTWSGNARISRYALTQFTGNGSPNPGWVDPTTTFNRFAGWPLNATGNNLQSADKLADGTDNIYKLGTMNTNSAVLVDFVETPTASSNTTACPGDSSATGSLPPFVRTPSSSTITSFYACVRGGGFNTNSEGRNQESAIFLRGNAAGRSGIPSTAKVVFDLQTRVLSRGSYEKSPAPQ